MWISAGRAEGGDGRVRTHPAGVAAVERPTGIERRPPRASRLLAEDGVSRAGRFPERSRKSGAARPCPSWNAPRMGARPYALDPHCARRGTHLGRSCHLGVIAAPYCPTVVLSRDLEYADRAKRGVAPPSGTRNCKTGPGHNTLATMIQLGSVALDSWNSRWGARTESMPGPCISGRTRTSRLAATGAPHSTVGKPGSGSATVVAPAEPPVHD